MQTGLMTYELGSVFTLRDPETRWFAAPDVVEQACHDAMSELMDIEASSDGVVHSSAVSATIARGQVAIEFCVDASNYVEADEIANRVLNELITDRLDGKRERNQEVQQTSGHLELMPA